MRAALVLLGHLADIVAQCAIPTFWSLHHASQPRHLISCSIALVNSIGNLGGFLGPSVLGAMHDAPQRVDLRTKQSLNLDHIPVSCNE